MKRVRLKILLVLMLLVSASAMSDNYQGQADFYICSAEFSSGYDYKNGRWIRDRFIPDDKYKIEKDENDKWTVYEFETEAEYMDCNQTSDGILQCDIEGDFIMNFKTMKFSVTSTYSYVHSTRRNRDPAVLTLGKCVEF